MTAILKAGTYLGCREKSLKINGLIFTDTYYKTKDNFEPHCHENYYLAYVINGHYLEKDKKKSTRCLPGSVVAHKVNEVHSNTSFSENCRILNIEFEQNWFNKNGISCETAEQRFECNSVTLRYAFQKIADELSCGDVFSGIGAESALMKSVGEIFMTGSINADVPGWVKTIKEIMHYENAADINLGYISRAVNRHPMHISREFPKYFRCSMSEYARYAKVERALSSLAVKEIPLSEISYICGFTDQSHFIKVFKKITGITPKVYRDLIIN